MIPHSKNRGNPHFNGFSFSPLSVNLICQQRRGVGGAGGSKEHMDISLKFHYTYNLQCNDKRETHVRYT